MQLVSILKNQLFIYSREIKNVTNKGFFHLFTSHGLVLIVAFFSQFFVAGLLEPTDMGRIKILQTYTSLFGLICGLGFDVSLLKLASENIGDAEKKKMYQAGLLVTIASFIVIYLLLIFFNSIGLVSSDKIITKLFPFYILFLLPSTLQMQQIAYFQARKEIRQLSKIQVIIKLISVLLIIVVTFFYKLNGYIISVVLTGFFAIIILELRIKEFHNGTGSAKLDAQLIKSMWHYARFVLLANVVGMLTATIDIYLVNYLIADRTEVGYYMFALTILSVYKLFPTTIQKVAFPYFSELSGCYNKWYSSYLKYNKLNHILVFLVFAIGVMFIPVIVNFAFSGKYDRSVYYFVILSIAWLIKNLNMMKGTAMMGQGRFDINLKVEVIVLALAAPSILLLIKFYGLNGAVIGKIIESFICYLAATFMFRQYHKRQLKKN